MAWGTWSRKPDVGTQPVVGLDLTASRARAVYGPAAGATPRTLALTDAGDELPLAVSLEHRSPEIGAAGLALCHRVPHLACLDFLPHLGSPRVWQAGRHRLDAAAAFALVAERLRPALAGPQAVAVTVPPYLTPPQVKLLTTALEKAKLPILGTAAAPLALAATAADADFATALVADADGHALTWTVLAAGGDGVKVLATVPFPTLGTRAWTDRLLAAVSDRCVRLCRRDPRDSAVAEQHLYEQLDAALDVAPTGRAVDLHVRTAHWYQDLSLRPEDLESFCAPLAKRAADGVKQALAQAHVASPAIAPPDVLWVTHAAARLPGLTAALAPQLSERTAVRPLPPDDTAQAAHALAGRWLRGELPRGHLDVAAPRAGSESRPARRSELASGGR